MDSVLRVLLIEDSEDDVKLVIRELRRSGYEPLFSRVDTREAMADALDEGNWDVVICDYNMPEFSAPDALAFLQGKEIDVPFIVVSGAVGEELAVSIMKAGAHDYIMKNNLTRLVAAIERELREAELRRQRKDLEKQLLQAQKMEAVGRLAGGVAHDFNNILTPIIAYTELILASHTLEGRALSQIQEVHKAAARASELVRQLLAFSRKDIIEPRVFSLNKLILDMEGMIRRLMNEDIALIIETAPDLGMVKMDPSQVEQVLVNIIINARDAMPEGGRLVIGTQNVLLGQHSGGRLSDLTPGEYVMLDVRDTGAGMSEEVRARIFEPFFTTKDIGKGTGLGLSTSYGIVAQAGGYIHVDSTIGKGTTFNIYLPRVNDEAPASPLRKESEFICVGNERILLAEDEGLVREAVALMLREQGYNVLEAGDGVEALRIAQECADEQIHLLLTDVVMPHVSGPELAKSVLEIHPEAKVLYTSGYTNDIITQKDLLTTEANFLQKPVSPKALSHKVRRLLDG